MRALQISHIHQFLVKRFILHIELVGTFIIISILMMASKPSHGQAILRTEYNVQLGANVYLHYNLGRNRLRNNFPGIKAFIGFQSFSRIKMFSGADGLLNYSTSLTLYNKTLGNSLNINFQDNQLDWTSSASFGVVSKDSLHSTKIMQSINNTPFANHRHNGKWAAFVGSNFIMNSSKRHQTVGMLGSTINNFSFVYYNDGGPIFTELGLADRFDRWWTGGLLMYWHKEGLYGNKKLNYNQVEFSFDQFTGYKPQMFELQKILGLDIQDYDIYNRFVVGDTTKTYNVSAKRNVGMDFNASQYKLAYNFSPFMGGSFGFIGSLRNQTRERYWALQDIIHIKRQDPVHPNREINRMVLGFQYNNSFFKL